LDRLLNHPMNEHQPITYKEDLYHIPYRYVWHGMFSFYVYNAIYLDKLIAQHSVAKIIRSIIIQLHELWLTRCQIIHTVISDGSSIEEKIDLRREVQKVITSLPNINIDIGMRTSTIAQLKGWLFEVYSRSGNIEAYNNINKYTMSYRDKVSQGISEEEYELRERVLQLEEDIRI